MNFEQICDIEPKVKKLLEVAQRVVDDGSQSVFCAKDVWFAYSSENGSSLRTRLDALVGYHAGNRQLNKPGLYELVEATLLAELPPCRNCDCVTTHRQAPKARRRFIQPRFPATKYCRLEDIEPLCTKCGQMLPHAKLSKKEKAA